MRSLLSIEIELAESTESRPPALSSRVSTNFFLVGKSLFWLLKLRFVTATHTCQRDFLPLPSHASGA